MACRQPIESGWLTSGPKVQEFERLFAERHGVKHAIAVTSATTALHLALVALGVGPGDEVIVPAFTWVSTANVVVYCGAKPVFVDIDTAAFNIKVEDLSDLISSKTKAIIAVHLFGRCADMEAIRAAAGNIPIVEDAACAAGAAYNGVPAGGLGTFGCFSFHPRKIITTGEGGMVTTNDDALAEAVGVLRNHGASISEEQRHHGPNPHILPAFEVLGFNYRMTDLQAAVGGVQIRKLDTLLQERKAWAQYYTNALKSLSWLSTPTETETYQHGWQSYVTMVDEASSPMSRNDIMDKLNARGVSTRPGTHAVHMLDYYSDRYSFRKDDFPNARLANDYSMAIPLHNRMTEEDYEYVVDTILSLA